MHGGAFIVGNPVDPNGLGLTRATGLTCYSIPYALAPEHQFPVALNQVEAAWDAITTRRVGRPVPAAVVLFTPAADLREFTSERLIKEGVDPVIKWPGMVDKAPHCWSPPSTISYAPTSSTFTTPSSDKGCQSNWTTPPGCGTPTNKQPPPPKHSGHSAASPASSPHRWLR